MDPKGKILKRMSAFVIKRVRACHMTLSLINQSIFVNDFPLSAPRSLVLDTANTPLSITCI
jgi:hypothetical protein